MCTIYSPNWFKCVLQGRWVEPVIRVNKSNLKARHLMLDGSIADTVGRYPLEEMKIHYFRRFFRQNPMDCLRVMFAAKYYGRIKTY